METLVPNGVEEQTRSGAEPPLYERLIAILSEEIAAGRLAAGDRLLESRLASRFGVSRAPARQALAALHSRGVLTEAPSSTPGYLVAPSAAERVGAPTTPARSDQPLSAVPTWQRIHGEVEEAVTSRIAFGSWRITETALGRHYGVSRTVAREVLARLESRGLVITEGKRWIAPELSSRRVEELYALRAILEPAALEDAAPSIPSAQLEIARTNLLAARDSVPSGEALDQLESELHIELLGHCPNDMLRKAMVQHQSLLLAHRFFYQWTARLYETEPFLEEHLAIVDALLAGHVATACTSLRDHLLASRARAVERIARVRDLVRHAPLEYMQSL